MTLGVLQNASSDHSAHQGVRGVRPGVSSLARTIHRQSDMMPSSRKRASVGPVLQMGEYPSFRYCDENRILWTHRRVRLKPTDTITERVLRKASLFWNTSEAAYALDSAKKEVGTSEDTSQPPMSTVET